MIRHVLPFALVLLAGCARSEEATFAQTDNDGAARVERVRQADGEDDEVALGEWRPGLQDDQTTLEFGPTGTPPVFSLGCDARRGTLLQRHGAAPAGDLPVMLITVGSETRRLAVASSGGAIPMLRATLPSVDPFRSVLTGATTSIIVRIGDSPPLVLPPSAMVGEYVTQCANGEDLRAAGVAVANQAATANQAAPAANSAAPAAR